MKLRLSSFGSLRAWLCAAAVVLWSLPGVLPAQVVIVESRDGGQNVANYAEISGNWANSSVKSSAPGATGGIGSRFATAADSAFSVTPTLTSGSESYLVEVTHATSSNIPTNLLAAVSVTGGSGLPTTTDVFNQQPANVWRLLGTLTLNTGVTQPSITFTKLPGSDGTGQRFYADAVRFTPADDPCVTVPQIATVNGPLAAGQTFVDVPNILTNATGVVVYADGVEIGRKTSTIDGGVERVTTSPLVKGQVITATQLDAVGVASCRPQTGALVGGGANPRLRISLSIRQNTTLTGPIGANGGSTNTTVVFLGATNVFGGGFALAPVGGKVFQPGTCWQTVTFQRGDDPANPLDPTYAWAGSLGTSELQGDFGVLDAIGLAIDDLTDTGPFRIFIDDLQNGDVIIQDFEAATNGQATVQFNQPSLSGTTSPFLLAQPPGSITPNVSQVTASVAARGIHSAEVSWQFKDASGGNWLRLVAQGSGAPNPQLDLRLPISFRLLLLPVGITDPPLQICAEPEDVVALQGQTFSLVVEATGTAPLDYQWYFQAAALAGANAATLTVANAQLSDAGQYYVVVSDGSGSVTSRVAAVFVERLPYADLMTPLWSLASGDRPYLATDGQQSGLAWNPISGNVLLVSRTGGEAVQILNGDTGADVGTLFLDPNVIVGGWQRIYQVRCGTDGSVYVCNLTTNATLDEFKIYSWFDDLPGGTPFPFYQGNPGGGAGPGRWGDTFDLREVGPPGFTTPEFLIAARDGNQVAVLRPASTDVTIVVSNAPAGAFNHGLAWGAGDTFWGKNQTGALYQVALDLTQGTATILHVYSNAPFVGPIGADAASQFLGAVSVATPDTLRLLDAGHAGNDPLPLDIESFPTDHPNPDAVGAVAFGAGRLYALDANNGILALSLRPFLRISGQPGLATLQWGGGAALQSATDVAGPYADVLGATSPMTFGTSTNGPRYFRLRE